MSLLDDLPAVTPRNQHGWSPFTAEPPASISGLVDAPMPVDALAYSEPTIGISQTVLEAHERQREQMQERGRATVHFALSLHDFEQLKASGKWDEMTSHISGNVSIQVSL